MMKRTFAYGAATNQGAWPVQEDGYFADPGAGVFAVADGFGGRGAGDLAAKLALRAVREAPTDSRARGPDGPFTPRQLAQRELFQEIHRQLGKWNEKRTPATRGGCSVVVAAIEGGSRVSLTACGAASAWLFRAGGWVPLLTPQAGPRRDPAAAAFPTQALGLGREIFPESRAFGWQAGDVLLLLSGGVSWEQEGYPQGLAAELAVRMPGADLGGFVNQAVGHSSALPASWNQTAVAVEAL